MVRKGALPLSVLIVLILLVVFLVIGISIFAPLFSSEVQFTLKEQTCRITLTLSKYFDFPVFGSPISAVCSAERIKMNDKLITKFKSKTESQEEATMRYTLERMNRCQKVYAIPSREGILKHKNCYVCFSLEKDTKDPLTAKPTLEQFETYIIETKSPQGKSYLRELQEGSHKFSFALGKGQTLNLAEKDYAIVYQDNIKAADWTWWFTASGAALCVLGVVAAPITGGISLSTCALVTAGGAVAGSTFVLTQTGGTNVDAIILTELRHAENYCPEDIKS